jgi:hypothetical protein
MGIGIGFGASKAGWKKTGASTPVSGLKASLISCWEFDETSGTTSNDSHGSNNGTITGATINQTGKLDKAYLYDGTGDYVNYGDAIDFERTDSFTISSWVKMGTISANKAIVSKMEGDNIFRGYMFRINNLNRPTVTLRSDNSTTNLIDVEFHSALGTTLWTHVLITYDGSSDVSGVKCYVNNTEITTKTTNNNTLSATISNSEPLNVGTLNDGAYYDWNGLIDQTAVWSKVLSTDEISDLYNTGSGLAYSSW